MALFSAKNSEDPTSSSEVISWNAWACLIWPTLYIVYCLPGGQTSDTMIYYTPWTRSTRLPHINYRLYTLDLFVTVCVACRLLHIEGAEARSRLSWPRHCLIDARNRQNVKTSHQSAMPRASVVLSRSAAFCESVGRILQRRKRFS